MSSTPARRARAAIRQIGESGTANVNARHLLVVEQLIDRSLNTPAERNMMLDADMREAMARAARKLGQKAAQYQVVGYTWNADDIVFTNGSRPRTLVATLRIAR